MARNNRRKQCPGRPDLSDIGGCGNTVWEIDWNFDIPSGDPGHDVWACTNCFHTEPRVAREAKTGGPRQAGAIEALRSLADWSEFKVEDHCGGAVWVTCEVGEGFKKRIVWGRIGARGAIKLTFSEILADDVKITQLWQIASRARWF